MAASKDLLYVNEKYLEKSNYNLCLGDNIYAASFTEVLCIGNIEFDQNSMKAKFSKKSIIIPSSSYSDLVMAVERAHRCFETKQVEEFQSLIYKYSKVHHLVAKLDTWEDELLFKLNIIWNFVNDKSFNRLIDDGLKQAVDTSQLVDKQWLHLKRGVYLKQRHVQVLQTQLPTLLEFSFYDNPESKRKVMHFVDYVLENSKLRWHIKQHLAKDPMTFQNKMDMLKFLVSEMFQDGEHISTSKRIKMVDEDDPSDGAKYLLDILSNKVELIFSIFIYHVIQAPKSE